MIFVTVGTRDTGFDRLIRHVDAIADDIDEPIRAQIGAGDYVPENIDWFRFMKEHEMLDLYRDASVIIAHAGAGTLLTALTHEKPVVIVPRRERHNESFDDHQLELANALRDRPEVYVVEETGSLEATVERARSQGRGTTTKDDSLVQFLSSYIEDIES